MHAELIAACSFKIVNRLDKIRIIIKELQKQRNDLKRSINEAVKDGEYLNAHFHNEAMVYLDRKLQTLRNLDDKNFDHKRMIQLMIKRAEVKLGSDHPDELKDFIKGQIKKLKQDLRELTEKEVGDSESTVLAKYLASLVSHEIKSLKIVLRRSSNFLLDIRRHRSGVKVLIPNLNSLRRSFLIHEENAQHFRGLGFVIDENESKMTLNLINRDREQLLMELQTIISKIVFEIFYFKEFQGETFIEIRE